MAGWNVVGALLYSQMVGDGGCCSILFDRSNPILAMVLYVCVMVIILPDKQSSIPTCNFAP